ncbi:MAG: 30S ribosomal protein S16 [Fusobacteriota bacterium]
MVKIRLVRFGRKKVPFFRLAAMEKRKAKKVIEYLGNYNPITKEIKLEEEGIIKFLLNGAQPTRTVKSLLQKNGVWEKFEEAKKA